MPVYLDWLTDQPTAQQEADLSKLLKDAPVAWQMVDSVQAYVSSLQGPLALGIFNGRSVALAELQAANEGLEIKRVLVRRATRERTVATQLIQRLCQWAAAEQITLLIRDEDERLNQLLALGFQKQGDLWVRRN